MSIQVTEQNTPLEQSEVIEQMNSMLGITQTTTTKTEESSDNPPVSDSSETDELPHLSAPAGPLSLDTLLTAIGYETRKQTCQEGVNSLEIKAEQQAETNQKELNELKEQLESMQKKDVCDGFLKAFSIIGTIVGAIASAASLVVGIATANPLLIAGGVAGLVMTIDSGLSTATNGEYCIASGVSALCQACGMDQETADKVGNAVSMALTLASIALCIGGAAAASKVTVDATSKIISVLAKTSTISNIVNGVNSAAKGATTIASGVYSYQISESQANVKDLEAILERLRMSIEMEEKMVESELERANELLEAVDDIVKDCNETLGTVLGANPAMA